METFTLNDGNQIPKLGIGVNQVRSADVGPALARAFEVGYRSVDTANTYLNERAVGQAVRDSGLPREEIYLTSKVWSTDSGYRRMSAAIDRTLKRLDTDYLDLLLVHQQYGDYNGAWKAMEDAVGAGKVRSIGISNFNRRRLTDLISRATVLPAVAQIERHPYFQQREQKAFLEQFSTVVAGWFPLGRGDRELLTEPLFAELGRKYGKSPAQVILRWHLQGDTIVIPGSTDPAHIRSNFELFDFALTAQEMDRVTAVDRNKRFHNLPELVERIIFQSMRMDYDKRQR
ncbi:aldo/keto reductase [Promicromonospora iranensis]|uniref:Diketogulonate reductase-like aldo/keto reductase n=1 Tax=Promicromonospora iranensis TaxID=1105144 RepID=A0ABU2CLW5_9MICO|nr:aldo/keto reductase [Promicromonospora iranensis]MDR7382303.1 diketogulonate reductase-like aldo/keto reductase [Promicromonospora iranensis]